MTDKLKTCPFCGGKAILNKRISSYDGTVFYGVLCVNTGCCGIQSLYTKVQAIDKWNTRKPMVKLIDKLDQAAFSVYDEEDDEDMWVVDLHKAIDLVKGVQNE